MDMRIYHTFVYCIETDKYHPFFSRPVNTVVLVFESSYALHYFKRHYAGVH